MPQVCASGGLKRESNSLAPGLKLRRKSGSAGEPCGGGDQPAGDAGQAHAHGG